MVPKERSLSVGSLGQGTAGSEGTVIVSWQSWSRDKLGQGTAGSEGTVIVSWQSWSRDKLSYGDNMCAEI